MYKVCPSSSGGLPLSKPFFIINSEHKFLCYRSEVCVSKDFLQMHFRFTETCKNPATLKMSTISRRKSKGYQIPSQASEEKRKMEKREKGRPRYWFAIYIFITYTKNKYTGKRRIIKGWNWSVINIMPDVHPFLLPLLQKMKPFWSCGLFPNPNPNPRRYFTGCGRTDSENIRAVNCQIIWLRFKESRFHRNSQRFHCFKQEY